MARQPVHIPPKHSPSPFRRTLCNVRVVSVRFNHDTTNAKTSALNIRKSRGETLPLPEWTAGQSISEPSLAAYAVEEVLSVDTPLRILVSFAATYGEYSAGLSKGSASALTPVKSFTGQLWVRATVVYSEVPILENLGPVLVSFIGGEAKDVPVVLHKATLTSGGVFGVKKGTCHLQWEFGSCQPQLNKMVSQETAKLLELSKADMDQIEWESSDKTAHRIFVIRRLPQAPWNQTWTNTGADVKNPWTDALEIACGISKMGAPLEDPLDSIANGVAFLLNPTVGPNPVKWTYNVEDGGKSRYVMPTDGFPTKHFTLTEFVQRWNGDQTTWSSVNCDDCSAAVLVFANLLGCELMVLELIPTQIWPVIPIGWTNWWLANIGFVKWDQPWKSEEFATMTYHTIAVRLPKGPLDLSEIKVWDICYFPNAKWNCNSAEPECLQKFPEPHPIIHIPNFSYGERLYVPNQYDYIRKLQFVDGEGAKENEFLAVLNGIKNVITSSAPNKPSSKLYLMDIQT